MNKCISNHPSKQSKAQHSTAKQSSASKASKQQRIEGENNRDRHTDRQRTGRKSNEEERGLEGGWLQI